jgi:hypothetical protein
MVWSTPNCRRSLRDAASVAVLRDEAELNQFDVNPSGGGVSSGVE